jgi:hypothetical protein
MGDAMQPDMAALDARGTTDRVTRGVCRMLAESGYGTLKEFRLPSGRRVDVMGMNGDGEFVIVEVKVSVEDFRGDRKWREYLPYCDRFYFAVPEGFPDRLVPGDCGLIVADGYGGAIRRAATTMPVNGNRKRRQLVRFALAASARLQRMADPRI